MTRPHELRKTVTVVFTDVAGSTALGEALDPEAVRGIMTRYFAEAQAVLERHGGTVEKFIGDAVMSVFGIPEIHEDDGLRAVRAAAEMRERLRALAEDVRREYRVEIAFRTGIHTGEVVAGDASTRQSFATGDAVNVAARLEQAADPGGILLGEATYRLVRDAVVAEPVEPLTLKGKSGAVPARKLVDVLLDAPAFTRRLDAAFVGRGEELSLLRESFERVVADRSCQRVTILGEPGIGKSRLARELVSSAGERARVLVGRCLSYGEGITYWPLAEIVKQVAGADPRAALAKLVGEDGSLVAERIAGAVGLADPGARPEEIFWAIRRLLEALAGERPLIVVLDDLQWAERTLLDLVEYLTALTSGPVLILCVARSDLLSLRPSFATPGPKSSLVSLDPLSKEESAALLERLADAAADPLARSRILDAAEGNPLFVEQMLALQAENGEVEREPDVPATVQAIIAARIDRLEAGERTVAERAAVEGRMFHLGTVAELVPDDVRDRVGSHVMSLVRKELVRPDRSLFRGDDGFRFGHILIRDAAYAAMPKEVRADLHERFASVLERKAGSRAVQYEEILAYHLEQAFHYRVELGTRDHDLGARAAERLGDGGRRALGRGDMPAAASLLRRAAAVLPADDSGRAALLLDLGDALLELGRLAEAGDAVAEATRIAEATGDERLLAAAALQRIAIKLLAHPEGSAEEALKHGRRAVPIFEAYGDDRGLSKAWHLVHEAHWFRGELTAARVAAERALEAAERSGDLRGQAMLRLARGGFDALGPTPVEQCIALFESDLVWARSTGSRFLEGMVLFGLGILHGMQRRLDDEERYQAEGTAVLTDLGASLTLAAAKGLLTLGRLSDAPRELEMLLRESYEALSALGEKSFFSTVAAGLADCVYVQGRYEEADALTREAEQAGASDDVTTQVTLRCVRAKLLARAGRLEEAERLVRDAVERAASTEYVEVRAESLAALAEVLQLAGRSREAAQALEEALDVYEAKGNLVKAEQIRRFLGDVTSTLTGR